MGAKGSSVTDSQSSGGLSTMMGAKKKPGDSVGPPVRASVRFSEVIDARMSWAFSYCILFCRGPKKASESELMPFPILSDFTKETNSSLKVS